MKSLKKYFRKDEFWWILSVILAIMGVILLICGTSINVYNFLNVNVPLITIATFFIISCGIIALIYTKFTKRRT